MRRFNNLYQKIYSMENLYQAEEKAIKGKADQYGVQRHVKRREANIIAIHEMLKNKSYVTSPYTTFKIFEPKERDIFRLPFYPDRIIHHAIMNVLEPVFVSMFTPYTYSCIKEKGIHAAARDVQKALRDIPGTQYCLKIDIKKFYPSIDHSVLKQILRRKFKDADLLQLLDGIIDSAAGVPIGNYLSQYFANYYLTGFDHWLKEEKRVQYCYRYADDVVILASSKEDLHQLLYEIRNYLHDRLNLDIKGNYQVFPVDARGIDFVGYRFYHGYTLLRKSIKKRFAKVVKLGGARSSLASYYGWAIHCNSNHLLKKLFNEAV
jgi:RNA-directed DNA polymerase